VINQGKTAMFKTVLPGLLMAMVVIGLPFAASAGTVDLNQRDASCKKVATVQYLDCTVVAIYACGAMGGLKAPVYREESYDPDGLDRLGIATRDGTPVYSADRSGRVVITNSVASLSETPFKQVQKTGKGKFFARGTMRLMGIEKPVRLAVELSRTDKSVTLSGQNATVFDATVSLKMPAPMGLVTSLEKTYLFPDLGIYVSGEATGGTMFKPDDTPHKPMVIQLPGQSGFDTIKPAYCGGSLSMAAPLTSLDGVPA
jgi:hypothetical protein